MLRRPQLWTGSCSGASLQLPLLRAAGDLGASRRSCMRVPPAKICPEVDAFEEHASTRGAMPLAVTEPEAAVHNPHAVCIG